MNEMSLFQLAQRLGATDDPLRDSSLEAQIDAFAARYGRPEPSRYDGNPGHARTAAQRAIARAEDAERELVWAQQALPEAEHRLAQEQKSANGKWILLGVFVIIVLAVLIGQGM